MSEKPGKPCSCPRCLVELAAAEERGRRAGIEEALSVLRGFTRVEVAEVAVRELLAPRDSGKEDRK